VLFFLRYYGIIAFAQVEKRIKLLYKLIQKHLALTKRLWYILLALDFA